MRAQDGDLEALDALVRHFQPRLLAYLRTIADDAVAGDLLQETLLSAVRTIRRLRRPDTITAWLFAIARNRAADHYRRRRRDRGWLRLDDVSEPADESETQPIPDLDHLHAAIDELPPPLAEVIRLHHLEGLAIVEVAEIAGLKAGTVKSRLHAARMRLAEAIARRQSREPPSSMETP